MTVIVKARKKKETWTRGDTRQIIERVGELLDAREEQLLAGVEAKYRALLLNALRPWRRRRSAC